MAVNQLNFAILYFPAGNPCFKNINLFIYLFVCLFVCLFDAGLLKFF